MSPLHHKGQSSPRGLHLCVSAMSSTSSNYGWVGTELSPVLNVFCIASGQGIKRRGNYTSVKNHFYEMNGDVGMAGWK